MWKAPEPTVTPIHWTPPALPPKAAEPPSLAPTPATFTPPVKPTAASMASKLSEKDLATVQSWVAMGYTPDQALQQFKRLNPQKFKEEPVEPPATTPVEPEKKSSIFRTLSQIPRNFINRITGGSQQPTQPSAQQSQRSGPSLNPIPIKQSFGEQASVLNRIIQSIPEGEEIIFFTDDNKRIMGMAPVCHGKDQWGRPSFYHPHRMPDGTMGYTHNSTEKEAARVANMIQTLGVRKYSTIPLLEPHKIKPLNPLGEKKDKK